MNFFTMNTMNPNFKLETKKNFIFFRGWVGVGWARISEFFFKGVGWVGVGLGEGGGRRVDGWMDRQTGPNQFAPSTSLKLGA